MILIFKLNLFDLSPNFSFMFVHLLLVHTFIYAFCLFCFLRKDTFFNLTFVYILYYSISIFIFYLFYNLFLFIYIFPILSLCFLADCDRKRIYLLSLTIYFLSQFQSSFSTFFLLELFSGLSCFRFCFPSIFAKIRSLLRIF